MPNRPFLDVFTRKVSLLKDDIQRNSSLVNEVIPKLLEQVRNIDPLFTVDTLHTGEGIKGPCKRTQHCWVLLVASVCMESQTMLALVAFSLKPVKLLGPYKRTQHCWPTTRNIIGSYLLRPFAWNHNNVGTCCV